MKDKDLLVVLPAYNEGKVIASVIKNIKKEGFKDILVVDDASADNTSEQARKAGAKVFRHVLNRGAGAATNTGLIYARNEGYKRVAFLDSDGQHSPKDLKRVLKSSGSHDVVIGSRMIGEIKKMPFQRKVANFVGSFLTWFFFGLFVRDSQSGFKVFNRKAIEKVDISFDRYEFCSEIIGEIKRNGLSWKEVPIKVIYSDHSMGNKGSGQSVWNGFRMILRFIFRN